MPVLARREYYLIAMYFEDHNPTHLHVLGLDGRDAQVWLGDLSVMSGEVERRAIKEASPERGRTKHFFWGRGMPVRTADIYDPLTAISLVRIDARETPVLRVTFDDCTVRDVDFSPVIARSKWFQTLNVPTTFEDVEIVNNGRVLQWVTGADFCADALRIMADEQLAAKGNDA